MIRITDKQEAAVYTAVNLMTATIPDNVIIKVLSEILAEAIHDKEPDLDTARQAADVLNFRIKQHLQKLAEKAG